MTQSSTTLNNGKVGSFLGNTLQLSPAQESKLRLKKNLLKRMKKNMALLKKAGSMNISKSSNNVIELNLNKITPFQDVDIEFDQQDDKMLSSEEVLQLQDLT